MSSFIDSMSEADRQSAISQLLDIAASQTYDCVKCYRYGFKATELNHGVCHECVKAIKLLRSGIHSEETRLFWDRHKQKCKNKNMCWRNLNG